MSYAYSYPYSYSNLYAYEHDIQERRNLHFEAQRDAAISLDVSPAFCEPLLELRSELDGLRAALPPPSLARVWPAVAASLDQLLLSQLVRRASFSIDGARQLRHDVNALLALFQVGVRHVCNALWCAFKRGWHVRALPHAR